ncbi:16S rRNA (cytosine(1402)-N(4))-methyltransferase RsmH [Desulforhopalus vacuolatus]|uniref:16S rRNA (cytosine(1402)-N(4))-methyltransferase RsmH n=1 Tax=Desulforhopalus vacuolatus TaxID=40414 RepID=UPI0019632500|nr:16S rRNA (cytosine(1402)-N(4))-methyltransferase RsmH [Desulforhopalus vacuolatus]MBM9518529.1 16S rRNA (cytosine(1402)-N(4))-methyltransferase RsmH [Desulforhopalus vacuolatus]
MCDPASIHVSVLLAECMELLRPRSGGLYVDCTLGLGGHTEGILQRSGPDGRVVGFDWDSSAQQKSRQRLASFGERLIPVRRNFAELAEGLDDLNICEVDGLLLDAGLSSLQLDLHEGRGFSFQRDEPLDMRMDNRRSVTAASILARADESELADILYYYGEERQARRIAAAIVTARKKEQLQTTRQLVEVVNAAVPRRFHPKRIHIATKTFQALRIAVNGELENLGIALDSGVRYMKPGARFCVISFHSLEDRLVKRKFRENPALEVITSRPVGASSEEVERNPRSRSARLRVAQKLEKREEKE